MATGSSGSEAPPDAIVRTYRADDGAIRVDTLISPDSEFLPRRAALFGGVVEEAAPYITHVDAADDGSAIIVGFCTRGECAGPGAPTADAIVTLYRSRDSGAAWEELGQLGPKEFVAGMSQDDILIGRRTAGSSSGSESLRWVVNGEALPVPAEANSRWNPTVLGDGSVAWQTDDGRLLDASGNVIASIPEASSVLWLSAPPGLNPELLAIWPDGQFTYGIAGFKRSGEQVLGFTSAGVLIPEAWAGDWLAYGHLETPVAAVAGVPAPTRLPSLIDLRSGMVCQITEPFSSAPFASGRNQVLAVQTDSSVAMTCDPAPIPSPPAFVPPPEN